MSAIDRQKNVGSDLLSGAAEIADFLLGDKKRKRRVYALAKKGLPFFWMGGELCALRSTLRNWIAEEEAASKGRQE